MTKAKNQDKDYDLPWLTILEKADKLLKTIPDLRLYQKFTCEQCLSRQLIDTPNKFYTEGQCQECGHVTNIKINGCGYMAHIGRVG